MLSLRLRRSLAVALVALSASAVATDAFAIRNRYTNEQNEGFAALFVEAFGRSGFADDEPIDRASRLPLRRGPRHRGETVDGF